MAQTLWINVKGDTKALVADLKKAENVTVQSGKKMATGVGVVTKGMNRLKGAVVAYLGVHTAKAIVNIADTYTSLESKLKLVTSSTGELKTTQAALLKVANESRTSYEGTVSLYTRLSRSTDTLGVSQDDLLKATEAVSKGLIVAGATSEEASSAMLQLSQGLSKGTLDGDELKSVMEAMPDVMKKVAKSMGVAYGDLKLLGSEGKLTSDVIFPALVDILGEVQGEFDQMGVTVGQATTVLKNSFFDIINDANKSSEATSGIAESILGLAKTIEENKDGIVAVFAAVVKGAQLAVGAVGLLGKSIQGYILLFDKLKGEADPFEKLKESLDAASASDGPAEKLRMRLEKLREELAFLDQITKNGVRSSEESREERARLNKAIYETVVALDEVVLGEKKVIKTSDSATKEVIKDTKAQTKAKRDAQEAYEKAVKEVNDNILRSTEQTYTKLSFFGSEYNKDQISRLTELDKEWLGINDDIEKDHEKMLAAMEDHIIFYTDEQKDKLTDMSEDWMAMNDEIEEDDAKSKDKLEENMKDYTSSASDLMDDFIDDMIVEGDSLGDAWKTLWKGMLSELTKVLASMAAAWLASKISKLFTTKKYHTGLWNNLSNREVPAVLLPNEMVIPEKYANQIRNNLGDRDSFPELANATNPETWSGSPTDIDLDNIGQNALTQGLLDFAAALASGQKGIGPSNVGKNLALNAMLENLNEMMNAGLNAIGATPGTGLLGPSSWNDMGKNLAGLAGALGLGGTPLGIVGVPAIENLGGYLGDKLGDLFDDREWETLRDLVEDGKMTPEEALARQLSAKGRFGHLSGYGKTPSTLGTFFGLFGKAFQGLLDLFSPTAPTTYTFNPIPGEYELEPGKGLGQEGSPAAGGEVPDSDGDRESSPGGAGGVHGGMDFIPKETTYMLDRGERVLSPRQNKDLTSFLNEARSLNGEVGRYIENISILMDKFDRVGILERAA